MTVNHQATTDLVPVISREKFGAVIFNLDGVVTDINEIHNDAWKRLFDEYLLERAAQEGEDLRPFHVDFDYRRYVEGRPRYQGVKHFLSARHIEVPLDEAYRFLIPA